MGNHKSQTGQILGTFVSSEPVAKTMEMLDHAGVTKISVYSPIDPEEANISIKNKKSGVGRFTLVGAFFGILSGLFFSVGTAILYPIETGGMPILSLPAIAIITFDLMLLFALLFTVVGFLWYALLSNRKPFVPKNVNIDRFGIEVCGDLQTIQQATEIMEKSGAEKVARPMASAWLFLLIFLLAPNIGFAFPWSQDMVDQLSRKPQEEHVLSSPEIIPHHERPNEVLSKDEAASIENPVDLSNESFATGKRLFGTFCALCHGKDGKGKSAIAKKIGEFPDFTKEEFRNQPDGCIYFAITNGANFETETSRPRGGNAEAEADHAHDEESEHDHDDGEAKHSHDEARGDAMHVEDDHEHGHEEEHTHEDEHGHDDGDGHAHGNASCDSGHEHNGDGHAHEHGSGKKHFMPPHRDAIQPIDRWHIVNYIKYELGQ